MSAEKSLSLPDRLEFLHSSLPHPGWLVGLLNTIVRILGSVVDFLGDHFPAGNAIATQFVGHDLPRFATTDPQ
jgi:hypothetical protein